MTMRAMCRIPTWIYRCRQLTKSLTHSLLLPFFLLLLSSSENGSPIDAADEGNLVATITKKRRGNDSNDTTETTDFAINVGEGKFISLTDPSSIGGLDSESRLRAFNQLQALQDQMAKFMQDLSKKDE
jgi:hypothetical protein